MAEKPLVNIVEQSAELSPRLAAAAAVEDYFTNTRYITAEGSFALETVPQLVEHCDVLFSTMDDIIAAAVYEAPIFRDVTAIFQHLTESGNKAEAKLILQLITKNLGNLFNTGLATSKEGIDSLAVYVSYVLPKRAGPIAKPHWVFINKLMDHFNEDEFRRNSYEMTGVYQEGDKVQIFDRLMLKILERDKSEAGYVNFVTELLRHRYGFRYDKKVVEDTAKGSAIRFRRNTEAVNMLKVWQDCDGRNAKVLIYQGETEHEDKTRQPTTAEVNMRKVQKVRSNIQVLEALREQNELRVARLLHRVNGIANFNRYPLVTLAEQYDLQVRTSVRFPSAALTCLSLLPYADHNGALNGLHRIVNNSPNKLEEIIVEGGTRRSLLVNILRATKGTAARQEKHNYLYGLPFRYILAAGHSDYDHIGVGKVSRKKGINASKLDMDMMKDPALYAFLKHHNLIDHFTYVVIKGCNAAEGAELNSAGYNIARTIKSNLSVADVIACSTYAYSDQRMTIAYNGEPTLTQTSGRRKAAVVSIDEQMKRERRARSN